MQTHRRRSRPSGRARACMLYALLLVAGLGMTAPASAQSLHEARASGVIGETVRGYVAPIGTPTPAITALVNSVNAGRRQKYQDVARQTGATLEQVELLTAQEIRNQVPSGTMIQNPDGSWVRK